MPNRARDWFRQAERDLEQAGESRAAGKHEWAALRESSPFARTADREAVWVFERARS